MKNIEELANHIRSSVNDGERFVIAISGFGGAGKSTLSEQLSTLLGNATLIHCDDFIASDEDGALEGHHLNWEVLEDQVLRPAKTALKLTSRIYDWPTNKPVREKVLANKYIIIEGSIWLLQTKLKQYFDLTIWVNVPQDIANARGKKRDAEEYGVNHDALWDNVWGPRENDSFNTLRPDKIADILLENSY